MLDFWGTWCAPCIEQLPMMRELKKKYKDLKIISIALMMKNETEKDLKDFVRNENLNWMHIADFSRDIDSSTILKLRIDTYPTYILVGPDRKIIYRSLSSKNASSKLPEILHNIYSHKP